MSPTDQRRWLALAFVKGDRDMQNVAQRLLSRLEPPVAGLDELLAQLPPADRDEITSATESGVVHSSTPEERERISLELAKAATALGKLQFEEAVWIMIPDSEETDAIWIEAVGDKRDERTSVLRLPSQVLYNPEDSHKHELLTAMRKAAWILHVHNHPVFENTIVSEGASTADRGFAMQWKSTRPEIGSKMKFFVVKEGVVTEYTETDTTKEVWSLPNNGMESDE